MTPRSFGLVTADQGSPSAGRIGWDTWYWSVRGFVELAMRLLSLGDRLLSAIIISCHFLDFILAWEHVRSKRIASSNLRIILAH